MAVKLLAIRVNRKKVDIIYLLEHDSLIRKC